MTAEAELAADPDCRIGVQRGEQQRMQQLVPENAPLQAITSSMRFPGERANNFASAIRIRQANFPARAPRRHQHPPRNGAFIGRDGPACAAPHIHEIEACGFGSHELVDRSDGAQVIMRRMIAGEHQMIAVVDRLVEHGIEIGAAAPARLHAAFDQADFRAATRQRNGGREAGQSPAPIT